MSTATTTPTMQLSPPTKPNRRTAFTQHVRRLGHNLPRATPWTQTFEIFPLAAHHDDTDLADLESPTQRDPRHAFYPGLNKRVFAGALIIGKLNKTGRRHARTLEEMDQDNVDQAYQQPAAIVESGSCEEPLATSMPPLHSPLSRPTSPFQRRGGRTLARRPLNNHETFTLPRALLPVEALGHYNTRCVVSLLPSGHRI